MNPDERLARTRLRRWHLLDDELLDAPRRVQPDGAHRRANSQVRDLAAAYNSAHFTTASMSRPLPPVLDRRPPRSTRSLWSSGRLWSHDRFGDQGIAAVGARRTIGFAQEQSPAATETARLLRLGLREHRSWVSALSRWTMRDRDLWIPSTRSRDTRKSSLTQAAPCRQPTSANNTPLSLADWKRQ